MFNNPLGEIKFLPYKTESPVPVAIHPYKERTLLIIQDKEPTIITINNKEVTESFHKHFESIWNQEVIVGYGFDAFEREWTSLFEELKPGESYDALGAAFGIPENENKFVGFFKKLHENRIARKIKSRLLFRPGAEKVVEKYGLKNLYSKDLQYKTLPLESESPVEIFVAKERTLLLVQKKEPVTITIRNKEIAESFKQHFNHLWNQHMVSYEGEAGVHAVFDDMLNYHDVYFIGGNDGIKKYFPQDWEEHNKERVKRKVVWHDLIDAKLMSNLFPGKKREQVLYYEYKILPLELSSPHVIAFYGDKIANIIWRENTMVTIIEDKEIREGYQKYFEYLWKNLGKN